MRLRSGRTPLSNMKTYEQTLADVIVNYVQEPMNPDHLGRMVALYHEGRIDARRLRRWIQERIGEREVERTIGMSVEQGQMMNELEIQALERLTAEVVV